MKNLFSLLIALLMSNTFYAQNNIPLDTLNWEVNAKDYIFESYRGANSIYLKNGSIKLKNKKFTNGTIEFDIYLKEEPAFPGVFFRMDEEGNNGEEWYIRPHLSGKPDANQATPLTNGISAWQLYFGEKYSFSYNYKYNDWTHVKIVVNGNEAQVYLDNSTEPNLSWNLLGNQKEGDIYIIGGRTSGFHFANIKVDDNADEIVNFSPIERKPIDNLIKSWSISDKFEEDQLKDLPGLKGLIFKRKWNGKINVEEGAAANISRLVTRYDESPKKNTVFAKIVINSNKKQTKLFDFGYSDRAIVLLNGKPLYKGNNMWRSRDYRYLGTVGLFDAVYLPLKKGENTLLIAVSENFGGWIVTGKFSNNDGVSIKGQ